MPSDDLPSVYAAVCAVNPRFAVGAIIGNSPDMTGALEYHDGGWFWVHRDASGEAVHKDFRDDGEARLMITAHWLSALPPATGLMRSDIPDAVNSWAVVWKNMDHRKTRTAPDPILALAAWLKESGNGAR